MIQATGTSSPPLGAELNASRVAHFRFISRPHRIQEKEKKRREKKRAEQQALQERMQVSSFLLLFSQRCFFFHAGTALSAPKYHAHTYLEHTSFGRVTIG